MTPDYQVDMSLRAAYRTSPDQVVIKWQEAAIHHGASQNAHRTASLRLPTCLRTARFQNEVLVITGGEP